MAGIGLKILFSVKIWVKKKAKRLSFNRDNLFAFIVAGKPFKN